jgi:hypothetical protein
MEKDTVTITREEYNEFIDAVFKLNCLEAGGVDNWEGYTESLRDGGYFDDDGDDED